MNELQKHKKQQKCLNGEFVSDDGTISYYKDNLLHRDNDLPAIISNEFDAWMIEGQFCREQDQPAIVYKKINKKEWFKNGVHHRDNDLPAIITQDEKHWFYNGERHRLFGPAIIYNNNVAGMDNEKYFFNGFEVNKEKIDMERVMAKEKGILPTKQTLKQKIASLINKETKIKRKL